EVEEAGAGAVAEAPAAEVDADPDDPLFVFENIDIMVGTADRAELLARLRPQLAEVPHVTPVRVVEERVVHILAAGAPDAEDDRPRDRVHDRPDLGADVVGAEIRPGSLHSARNVETN